MESLIRNWPRQPEPDPDEELRKIEMAIRQLERAELYVVSAAELGLARWEQRHALHRLRGEILAVCDLLRRPEVR